MLRYPLIGLTGLVCALGCEPAGETRAAQPEDARAGTDPGQETVCRIVAAARPLPAEVRETSGLAQSRRRADLFWTHNDAGNDPLLHAFDGDGRIVATVHVEGAELVDWEDLEAASCDGAPCLLIADIGDNSGARRGITIYRVSEPEPGATSARATPLHARYPDGPHDAESLFVARSGDLFVITKGRHGSVMLYRYPAPLRPGEVVTLERVKQLAPRPGDDGHLITAATTSPDGQWVAVRSHHTLWIYAAARFVAAPDISAPGGEHNGSDAEAGTRSDAEAVIIDLRPLGEAQGEAIALGDDGTVWLTSEAERGGLPSWSHLDCPLPAVADESPSDDTTGA